MLLHVTNLIPENIHSKFHNRGEGTETDHLICYSRPLLVPRFSVILVLEPVRLS